MLTSALRWWQRMGESRTFSPLQVLRVRRPGPPAYFFARRPNRDITRLSLLRTSWLASAAILPAVSSVLMIAGSRPSRPRDPSGNCLGGLGGVDLRLQASDVVAGIRRGRGCVGVVGHQTVCDAGPVPEAGGIYGTDIGSNRACVPSERDHAYVLFRSSASE